MNQDALQIEILPDGSVKTTTDQVSPANHGSADQFLAFLAKLTGGETIREKRSDAHSHQHHHHHHEHKA